MQVAPTRDTLRKKGNMLLCIIPECGQSEAHRIEKVYRLCTIHHRLYMELFQAINLVPLESKDEILLELMCLYNMTLRE